MLFKPKSSFNRIAQSNESRNMPDLVKITERPSEINNMIDTPPPEPEE